LTDEDVQDIPISESSTSASGIEESLATVTNENVAPSITSTPTATRFQDVLGLDIPKTPRHRVQLAGKLLTPRSQRSVRTSIAKGQNIYATARQLFAQSSNANKVIGRETEKHQLRHFVSKAIENRRGGCTYVSGPPGTGKSALVQELVQEYESQPTVNVGIMNCVTCKTSTEAYERLLQELVPTVKTSRKSAKQTLANLFTSSKQRVPTTYLVLMDEIDNLLDGDCDVLYSMFEWALHRASSLVLIGIANALDLTDRFLPRLKSRNLKPQLLPFLPYTAQQVSTIITEKLCSLLAVDTSVAKSFIPIMHPAAVQLCSKKIASQTGDLRKAFNLVRRTIDQMERETSSEMSSRQSVTPTKQPLTELANLARTPPLTPPSLSALKPIESADAQPSSMASLTAEDAPRATIAHVARLASSLFNNGTLSRLSGLNLQQKAVLCSLVAGEKRRIQRDPYTTPSKSTTRIPTVKELFGKYSMLCKKDEGVLQPLKNSEFRDVVASLETLGLIHESCGRATGLLTPSSTSRGSRNSDEKQVICAVSERELRESLTGAGADLLQRLFDE